MAKRRLWSKIVEEHGVRVRLFERDGTIYRDVVVGRAMSRNGRPRTVHDVKSLGHRDRRLAERQASALCRELASARLTGAASGRLTLGQVWRAYERERLPHLRPARQVFARSRAELFLAAWGADLDLAGLSQGHVDRYVAARRAGRLVPAALVRQRRAGPGREPARVADGTLDSDFRWLSSLFNWARKHRVNGRPILAANPLHGLRWPREQNVRRPVASEQRYRQTLEHADAVDPAGRLRCMLALARYTGRRVAAICELRASDVLRTTEQVRATLAALGMDERAADYMPHGAIFWRPEADKQGYATIAPLSQDARAAVDEYLRQNPRMGDVPLFPAPENPDAPLRRDRADRWLRRAERLAGLPRLVRGGWHAYRRLWAVERKHLPDVDVAAAGGWKDTRALKQSYQQPDPATIFAVVQGRRMR